MLEIIPINKYKKCNIIHVIDFSLKVGISHTILLFSKWINILQIQLPTKYHITIEYRFIEVKGTSK